MDRPVTHAQESTLPIRPVPAKPPSRRIGLAFLTGPAGHERYALAYLKGNTWPRIGRAAKMTGLSAKTLVRCDRLGWIPQEGIKTHGGARARYFHLQTLYHSRIFTFEKAARYFGLKYEQ